MADELYDEDATLEERDATEKALDDLHDRAMKRFDEAVLPQLEGRALSLAARRFIAIAGAQWEGEWADPYENAIKLEIDKVARGHEKIQRDYNENRIVPDFRPAGGKGDQDSADTLDGLHRADDYHFKAQQARDNAFSEASAGGMGAYRLATDWADPYDKDSDEQRINPGLIIADADQRVFFDPADQTYDKSKSRYCFVLTPCLRSQFEDEYDEAAANWPDPKLDRPFDWFTADVVIKAEYYEVEDTDDRIMIFTHKLSGEEQRWWKSELEPSEISDLKAKGWEVKTRPGKRRRVSKSVLSGLDVLKKPAYIAGGHIPIVPVYGKRWFVDGIERFEGCVQKKMDAQRLRNSLLSRLAETSAQSPREIPIFAPQQIPAALQTHWANMVLDRHPYALAEPLLDPVTGQIAAQGAIGNIPAATVSAADAALIQIAGNDLIEDQQDGADEVKANTSEEAMQLAATRVDARSGIFLDNMRQSVQCEGEIYLSMASEVYWEAEREVETMSEDGDDGIAVLQQPYVDPKTGKSGVKNDFSRGRFKCVVTVTEATATRRDKTVKSMLHTAEVAQAAGDQELAQVAILTAVMNQDGEGTQDMQRYARGRLVKMGVVEPTDEEKKIMDAASQQPDPSTELVNAQIEALKAGAAKDMSDGQIAVLKTLIEAYNAETGRLKAITAKDFPLPPDAVEELRPLVEQVIAQSMASPDVLPAAGMNGSSAGSMLPQQPPQIEVAPQTLQ